MRYPSFSAIEKAPFMGFFNGSAIRTRGYFTSAKYEPRRSVTQADAQVLAPSISAAATMSSLSPQAVLV
jgi:hypothetical protein